MRGTHALAARRPLSFPRSLWRRLRPAIPSPRPSRARTLRSTPLPGQHRDPSAPGRDSPRPPCRHEGRRPNQQAGSHDRFASLPQLRRPTPRRPARPPTPVREAAEVVVEAAVPPGTLRALATPPRGARRSQAGTSHRARERIAPSRPDSSPVRADVVPAGQAGRRPAPPAPAADGGQVPPRLQQGRDPRPPRAGQPLDLPQLRLHRGGGPRKITLLSKTPVTAGEAYAAFLAALNTNGIAMYQTGKYWKLVRIADAEKGPSPRCSATTGTSRLSSRSPSSSGFATWTPTSCAPSWETSRRPQGADIQTIPPDILLVTDIGLNVRRIEKLLESLTAPARTTWCGSSRSSTPRRATWPTR